MSAAPARRRRTTPEVRREILSAAEELFASRGFGGTTTRAVAKSAGVSEALVYTHFGSKLALFEAAVVERYESFVAEYVDSWTALLAKPSAESRHDFICGLVRSFADFFTDNRDILLTYLEYHRIGDGQAVPPAANFAAPLRQLEAALARHREDFGFRELDVQITVRAIISMVLGLVLHDDVMFAGTRRPSRERLLRTVTDLVLDGLEQRA